jgi:LacI family transcriptional regulator
MNSLLEQNHDIDGVVAFSDEIAYGVMHAIRSKELKIPEDIRIIGNGDYETNTTFDLKLSTVMYPKYEMGKTAACLLLKMINQKETIPKYHRIVLSPELILRDT